MRLSILSFVFISILIGCDHQEIPKSNPDTANPDPTKPDPATVYFVVGENNFVRGESFIIGLTDPDQIATARSIIQNCERKIVVAEISLIVDRSKEINFDPGNNRQWSWYVSDVLGFADVVAAILDGGPSFVEKDFNWWVNNTKGQNGKGRIGFINFTIKREIRL